MPALNNEIDVITVGGVNNDIRDTATRAAIGPTEPLNVASAPHLVNEVFFSNADRRLYKALVNISIGDTLTPGVNVEQATLATLMYQLFAQSPEQLMRNIADYETTGSASKTFHEGDRIFLSDGSYCRVTTTVYQGTEWILNSNIELELTVSDLIKTLENTKENKKVHLVQRLNAGDTAMQFTDDSIDSTKLIRVGTEIYGRNPITMTQDGHVLTLTFKAQSEAMNVHIYVEEGT